MSVELELNEIAIIRAALRVFQHASDDAIAAVPPYLMPAYSPLLDREIDALCHRLKAAQHG